MSSAASTWQRLHTQARQLHGLVSRMPRRRQLRQPCCFVQADGGTVRVCDGWRGQRRALEASPRDRSAMLVVCAAGRHSDDSERPQYSVLVSAQDPASSQSPASSPQAQQPGLAQQEGQQQQQQQVGPWTCTACTYRHEGAEAGFLACAVCGTERSS